MSIKDRFRLLTEILKIPKVRNMTLYIFFITLTIPNMETYITYSNEEQFHIEGEFESFMIMLLVLIATGYFIIYTSFKIRAPIRVFLYISVMCRLLSQIVFAYVVTMKETNGHHNAYAV